MTPHPNGWSRHAAIALAFVFALAAGLGARAETSTSSAQPLALSGTYELANVKAGLTAVTMRFSATIHNTGDTAAAGQIVLRHPNVISKVFYRFGDKTIAAREGLTVSGNVSVPRDVYDGWASGGPAVFFYAKNDRGDIKTYRIALSAAQPSAPPVK
jgi:hypothetical protein